MRSKLAALGFVLVLIVMAIVLYLNARATKELTPNLAAFKATSQAIDAQTTSLEVPSTDTMSTAQPSKPVRRLPGMQEMQQNTQQHAATVQEGLAETNQ